MYRGGERSGTWLACMIAALCLVAGAAIAAGDGFPLARADTHAGARLGNHIQTANVAGGGCALHSRHGRAEADALGSTRAAPGLTRGLPRRQAMASSSGTAGARTLGPGSPGRPDVLFTLPRSPRGSMIPPGFLGLSLEYRAIEAYAGSDPGAINPVFEQLISNLSPGQAPRIRIGGDSTDWTWWPVPRMPRPPGVSYTITSRWLAVTRSLATALGARLSLGINLEADSRTLAATEAVALRDGIGSRAIAALEPGNEPELYPAWGWYCSHAGREVPGRPPSYDFPAFVRDFSTITNRLPTDVPLAGPALGSKTWFTGLSEFLAAEPRVRVVTLHRYPLQNFVAPASPRYPTVSHLLSDAASRGLADSVSPYVRIAHARHLPLRIDEMNSVSAGTAPGVADSFASALWILDTLFEMARVGVDGVNVHTFPGATYELFHFSNARGRWQASVSPEYYGLLMFAQAAPLGSRLLTLSDNDAVGVKAWATRARDQTIRLVLINKGASQRTVAIAASGETAPASLEQLRAPGLQSAQGVTLGGQTFGRQTDTGVLAGRPTVISVTRSKRLYVANLPPASAALLTIR